MSRPTLETLDIDHLLAHATLFETDLQDKKLALKPAEFWYPYGGAVSVLYSLSQILTGANRDLGRFVQSGRIADIGAADGALAFFMESLGFRVDLIDNPATNFNKLEGARMLRRELASTVEFHTVDLDEQFDLDASYELAFFMGILYHLKNPFFVLERLARHTRFLFLSTRIASWTPDYRAKIEDYPLAYLVGEHETNNDATNFWMFTETGLRQLFARTGWTVRDFGKHGNTDRSDPVSFDGDERAFCLLESTSLRA